MVKENGRNNDSTRQEGNYTSKGRRNYKRMKGNRRQMWGEKF
jgi:hypothetical protein